ncbi:MAG: M56 family metallopeptidase [Desulfobacteraceae bacterium]|nr:M56 family metallopeptidase [Desulfobacteraceae bacterium]
MIRPDEIAQTVLGILSIQSVYALVLFPLVWGLVKCCRGRHLRWQHGFWFLILLRLVLPPDMAAPWSAGHLIRSITPNMVSQPFLAFPNAPPIFSDKQNRYDAALSNAVILSSQNLMVPANYSRPAIIPSPTAWERFYLIIFSSWLAVVCLLLAQFVRNRRRFWKIAWKGRTIKDSVVLDLVQTWRRRLHIRRRVKVKAVALGIPSYTMGFFRPVVVLPEHLISKVGSTSLEPVLAHELVHVKRWDDLAICLQELVRILYFFHPLVWFVIPRLTWTREAMCDATVLSQGTLSPGTYGKQMLAFLRSQVLPKKPLRGLAEFTAAAREMAFRLKQIQKKEDNMKTHTLKIYLAILLLGLFLLPMAPVVSSNQVNTAETISDASQTQDQDSRQMVDNALIQYILRCVPCQNPKEISHIIWGDLIKENFQKEDFSRLVSTTDCDIVENIGNGQKAYVFYLLAGSRQGLYRPNFHFIKKQKKLIFLYKSRNTSIYATDRPKVNGRYEIEEGWRADLFDRVFDDRVNLAWASRVWFWTGTQYIPAYTDYTVKDTTDPSLLGTRRVWDKDTQSLYEASSRM